MADTTVSGGEISDQWMQCQRRIPLRCLDVLLEWRGEKGRLSAVVDRIPLSGFIRTVGRQSQGIQHPRDHAVEAAGHDQLDSLGRLELLLE